ncbi:hypothetical protein WJX73_006002 [Symbiochloris irregularis]|uniref:Uncharacterized protein n=1 Tax=Symbiochloris irregularis TaxID=706552 RepID=A0AAW1NQA7_9CHLO
MTLSLQCSTGIGSSLGKTRASQQQPVRGAQRFRVVPLAVAGRSDVAIEKSLCASAFVGALSVLLAGGVSAAPRQQSLPLVLPSPSVMQAQASGNASKQQLEPVALISAPQHSPRLLSHLAFGIQEAPPLAEISFFDKIKGALTGSFGALDNVKGATGAFDQAKGAASNVLDSSSADPPAPSNGDGQSGPVSVPQGIADLFNPNKVTSPDVALTSKGVENTSSDAAPATPRPDVGDLSSGFWSVEDGDTLRRRQVDSIRANAQYSPQKRDSEKSATPASPQEGVKPENDGSKIITADN